MLQNKTDPSDFAIIDGLSHTVFNAGYSDSYDGNSNLVHSADALGFQHQQSFDALNRLNSAIANYNGTDPATKNTLTAFDHDALDRLDGVADPSGLNTLYTYDGLNNRTELQSPDTGTSTDTGEWPWSRPASRSAVTGRVCKAYQNP